MFVVEYFHEFCKLYTTCENTNREDMGVVASNVIWIHESIMASLYHYFKRDSAVPSPHRALSSSVHGQQQSLRN